MLETQLNPRGIAGLMIGIGLLGAAILTTLPGNGPEAGPSASYIVQGRSLAGARAAVEALGGAITHELGVIRAVATRLTPSQQQALHRSEAVRRLYENRSVETAKKALTDGSTLYTYNLSGTFKGYTEHPAQVQADRLHADGLLGEGVTLAVLDSGLNADNKINRDSSRRNRLLAHYDATTDWLLSTRNNLSDKNGHGTHVTSIVADPSTDDETARHNGIAQMYLLRL